MSLPKYPHYKPSGVEWLGDVPAHWESPPLKRVVARIESGVSVNAVDEPAAENWVGVLKTSCVYSGWFDPNENKAVIADEINRVACPVTANTLIVSRMNTPALVGAAGFVAADAPNLFLPDRLWQVHFNKAAPVFVHYWTASPTYRAQVERACAGTSASMQNLSQDDFLRFVLPLPPRQEQQTIAAFLDHETAKIDALIAEQAKLIALLAEKRQATISHAVTRGLDPAAPMKDSGVAWLGEVPAHWAVVRVRHAVVIDNSLRLPINREDRSEMVGHYPYWGPTGIIDYIDEFRYEGERALIGEDGDHFTKYSIWPMTQWATGQFNVNNHAHVISDGPKCTARWFYFSFLHRDIGSDLIAQGVSRLKLTREGLSNLWLAAPPLEEQTLIMKFIEQEMARLVQLQNEAERAIALLKERRSALIAAAVTGQIDVRGWTAPARVAEVA